MQTFEWYVRRLRSMSPAEILWRAATSTRGVLDHARHTLKLRPRAARRFAASRALEAPPPFRIPAEAPQGPQAPGWLARLRADADEIAAHRLSFFNLRSQFLGDPIDWHRDHWLQKSAPVIYAPAIDYRDTREAGDCKLVWEPNRHHQLVVLARAWRATGEQRYATAVLAQLDSWLRANPFGAGMNWRSSLELGIRLINWVWALDLIRDAGPIAADLRRRLLESLYLHCWTNARSYSRGSSSNNHLIGEAAGVYVATAYFPDMPGAARWRRAARTILIRELLRQSYPSGCTREQAIGYQMFVLEFYVACGLVGRWSGEDFPPEYWQRVERMIAFLGELLEGGDSLPFFGDADDGCVLNLGRTPRDPRDLLAIGAILFGRADFKALAGPLREPAWWLCGAAGASAYDALAVPPPAPLASRAYADAGYYLLQCGTRAAADRISVLFDCGEHGLGSIAAHGHADSLSFALRAFGTDVFVDPGTYDYFTYPAWRSHFRSTRAHNTVEIDGVDQSTMLGPFMWGQRAVSRCLDWQTGADQTSVRGEHDGYARLAVPALHRRSLQLDAATRTLSIVDEIVSTGSHRIALHFQLAEHCQLEQSGSRHCVIRLGAQRVILSVDPALELAVLPSGENPIQGWVSRGYHHKAAAPLLVARGHSQGTTRFRCTIEVQPPVA
ncbi:MAG: alginate lyase family protein [Gammaproteobacteria bacterium]|nr:alginate lyase family protein [Gammaproteobacteria bacterium]